MQSVLFTPTFLRAADRLGVGEDELDAIAEALAKAPEAGDLIGGTGGARKVRFRRPGAGKSGGYRTIHYFGGQDVPVFLLTIYGKGDRANLTKAERNALATLLPTIATAYRKRTRKEPT